MRVYSPHHRHINSAQNSLERLWECSNASFSRICDYLPPPSPPGIVTVCMAGGRQRTDESWCWVRGWLRVFDEFVLPSATEYLGIYRSTRRQGFRGCTVSRSLTTSQQRVGEIQERWASDRAGHLFPLSARPPFFIHATPPMKTWTAC